MLTELLAIANAVRDAATSGNWGLAIYLSCMLPIIWAGRMLEKYINHRIKIKEMQEEHRLKHDVPDEKFNDEDDASE